MKKKLRLQVAALQKQIDEQSQLSEIAAVFEDDHKSSTTTTTTGDERSLTMARKVMKIIGRGKKADSL